MLPARTRQDGAETINSEVMLVFRKKSRGQVIGAELQEGFAHLGTAVSEAGRLAAEQLGPRVEAAREAARLRGGDPDVRESLLELSADDLTARLLAEHELHLRVDRLGDHPARSRLRAHPEPSR